MIDHRIIDAFPYDFPLDQHLMVLAYMGSKSHNTYLPSTGMDDVDYMGIVLPPKKYLIGLHEWDCWTLKKEELDVVTYSLRKMIGLLLKCNPNVLGLLWLPEEMYVHKTYEFQYLWQYRSCFSSKQAFGSFVGYANGQLQRMTIFDVQAAEKMDALAEEIVRRGWTVEQAAEGKWPDTRNDPEFGRVLHEYKEMHRKYLSGYMGEKRKAIVRKFGYDVKQGSHLIRLLRMGNEFLRTGELRVYRTDDADELRAIKRGEWTLDQVKAEADRLFKDAHAALTESKLPDQPDYAWAEQILLDLTWPAIIDPGLSVLTETAA